MQTHAGSGQLAWAPPLKCRAIHSRERQLDRCMAPVRQPCHSLTTVRMHSARIKATRAANASSTRAKQPKGGPRTQFTNPRQRSVAHSPGGCWRPRARWPEAIRRLCC
eukprot:UN4541